MASLQDKQKTLTVEQLRQRYNLDDIGKTRKAVQLVKDSLNKTETELNEFIDATTKNLKELQDQVDGNITTWFFNGVPTTENQPANEWITEEDKVNHLGDLYYDQDTGYAYRWAYENNSYVWSKIVDADVVEALAIANAAQDTADSKRRVFVENPVPPYDIGDIWIKDDSELYRCRCTRIKEDNFNIADWIIATKYTDDTVALQTKGELDQFKTEVSENYTSNATFETTVNSINGRVEESYIYTTTVEAQVQDIVNTTNYIQGSNTLEITQALPTNVLEYHVDGKCVQDATPTTDFPIDITTITGTKTIKVENEDKTESKEVLIDLGNNELCSIREVKDTLDIINGQVAIHKYIGKIDSYNGESITTDYISTTGELSIGATVYYILEEDETIALTNTNMELFNGTNYITFVEDIETTTSIKYLRETPISGEYALNQNVETSITEIKNSVEIETTATNAKIDVINETLENGVTKVDTTTGFVLDGEGFKVSKSDSEMNSLLDHDGLVVKRNDEEVLSVRSNGVETENLTVRTYLHIGSNLRAEDYKDGTGFFYVGGAD